MTNSIDADADARWAAAASIAEGVVDAGFRKRRRKTILWIGSLLLAAFAVGFGLALWLLPAPDGSSSGGSAVEVRLIVMIVLAIVGIAVGIVGFVWARRTGRYITRWSAVISPLNMREKKSVRRQLAGKEPADEEHLPTILAIGRQNQLLTQGIAPLYGSIVILDLATAFGTSFDLLTYLNIALALLFVAVGAQLAVLYRRTERFIEKHSPSVPTK